MLLPLLPLLLFEAVMLLSGGRRLILGSFIVSACVVHRASCIVYQTVHASLLMLESRLPWVRKQPRSNVG